MPDALLAEVHEKGGEDEAEKANVHCGDELLAMCIDHRAEQLPGAAATVHAHHAQNLEESKAAKGRRGKDLPRTAH